MLASIYAASSTSMRVKLAVTNSPRSVGRPIASASSTSTFRPWVTAASMPWRIVPAPLASVSAAATGPRQHKRPKQGARRHLPP